MKNLVFLVLVVFCGVFLGCKPKPEEPVAEADAKSSKQEEAAITAKDIAALSYNDYVLSALAQEKTSNWGGLHELNNQVNFLKKGDLSFFAAKDSIVKAFITNLKTNLPPSVDTNIINARLVTVEAKVLKFNDAAGVQNLPKKTILENLKEVLVAVANLNLQVNKKFELESNNINKSQIGLK